MRSEDILLERVPNEGYGKAGRGSDARQHWRVTGTYRFENPTAHRVSLQMGFPERRCVDSCYERRGEFHGLSTTVRGQPVTQRQGSCLAR